MLGKLEIRVRSMRHSVSGPSLIENLELGLAPQSVASLLGPSGIGKTTLLRIIAGLERRFDGQILLDMAEIAKPTRDVQLVFQDYRLLPWKTAYENIRFAGRQNSNDSHDRAEEWLNFVGLASRRDAWPKTLSGGEAGRVAFARAFVDQPKVLLLDEPFSGLDIVTKRALQEQLLRALTKQPATVLMVSHSVEDAVFMSDSIHVLTPSPMGIARTFSVDLPRPRDPASREFLETVGEITAFVAGDTRQHVQGARRFDDRARMVARG